MTVNQNLNSTLIKSVSFDNGRLTLGFTNGKETTYNGVPQEKVDGLIASSSPGRFYNSEIKSQYSH